MNTIICAVDGSADSAIALEAASLIAERSAAVLLVANVQPVNPIAKRSEQLDAGLGIANELVERHGVERAEVVPLIGDPAIELASLAAARQASMIVVGARGKGRRPSMFRSRLQRELAAAAGVPVVIAPSVPQLAPVAVHPHVEEHAELGGKARNRRSRRTVRSWSEHASSMRPRPTGR